MRFDILSLFPALFRGPFEESILKRAREKGLVDICQVDIRDFAENKHLRVDDRPYGGGPGMVLRAEPVVRAIRNIRPPENRSAARVIHLSPQGGLLTAKRCEELAKEKHLILLCGHYEGIDQRALELEVDEEVSIGDYVLTNGCLPAMVLVDAVVRFLPGVLGHADAAREDSFQDGLFDCPHYTRPEVLSESFGALRVPPVLLQGDPKKVNAWRREASLEKTRRVRPELVAGLEKVKSDEETIR